MTRKKEESYLDFKERMMDPISSSFCAAKWYNATIWLGHGQTTSCHHPPAHFIKKWELKKNASAIHNTKHKKEMRKMMLEGKRPGECEYCWKIEDIGRDNISDRIYKSEIFKDEDIKKLKETPWDDDVNLRTLEVSFSRACNFACSYCNPAFSTSWVKDIEKYGAYKNIISDGRGHYNDTSPYAQGWEGKDYNPYINAFWEWWNDGLSESLHEIRVTGGEPLLTKGVWELFEWFKNNRNSNIRYAINSNLCVSDKLIDKLIDHSQYVKNLDIYTSCESIGKQAEYIRDGLDYNKWKSNLHKLFKSGHVRKIHMMMTINSLCLDTITEFMDDIVKEFKSVYGGDSISWTLNILRFPSFQAPSILPLDMKIKYKEKLQIWLDKNRDNNLIQIQERDHVQRLIDYLETVSQPHRNTAEEPKLFNDFKVYYYQYDKRRNKNFMETFSQDFIDFYNSIKVEMPKNILDKTIKPAKESEGNPAKIDDYDKE
jgi:organic radical activating enzyme